MENAFPTAPQLFISYAHADSDEVHAFVAALASAGIAVWLDQDRIEYGSSFPDHILDGLARSSALLAWYSEAYRDSSYCQMELRTAWIAARGLTHDVLSRILIANPLSTVAHIAVGDLGRQNYPSVGDRSQWEVIISTLKSQLAAPQLAQTFATVRNFQPSRSFGRPTFPSPRFVGRRHELWQIHTRLHPIGLTAHGEGRVLVQTHGLGGVGKTMLAAQYATDFATAYPGGIFWLRAYGFNSSSTMTAAIPADERDVQLEHLAVELGIDPNEKRSDVIVAELKQRLAARPAYLWIVDDLPPSLNEVDFLAWCAPTANGHTLLTTRSSEYAGAFGAALAIDVLSKPAEILRLRVGTREGT